MKLETERLILRDFVADDWQRVLEYQTDPLYLRYYEWTAADRTPEAVQEFVGWVLDHQKQQPRFKFQLAIVLKSDNLLVGNCGIRMDSPNASQADIGYELDPGTGTAATPPKPHMPSSTLASAGWDCTVSGPGAWQITLARPMCWRSWACSWKDGCARTNTTKAGGGIR